MVEEGHALGREDPRQLTEVPGQRVGFNVDERVETEGEVDSAILHHGKTPPVIGFEPRPSMVGEPLLARLGALRCDVDTDQGVTVLEQEFRPSTESGGNLENRMCREKPAHAGVDVRVPLRRCVPPRSRPPLTAFLPVVADIPFVEVFLDTGHRSPFCCGGTGDTSPTGPARSPSGAFAYGLAEALPTSGDISAIPTRPSDPLRSLLVNPRGVWHPAAMTAREDVINLARRAFARLPPSQRLAVLHALGKYAPWEDGFDFTPPALHDGEQIGPPDFVGIGVQKAGTTWWYSLLQTHPAISSRDDIHKERHFFDRFGTMPFEHAEIDAYQGWFPRPAGTTTGEWTPDYFTMPWVPPLLHAAAPSARLLVVLRDPVERFRSGLAHQAQLGLSRNGTTITDAVARGFYDRSLTAWMNHFDSGQILVLQHEKCVEDRDGQLDATFAFLQLPPHRVPPAELPARPSGHNASATMPSELRARLVDLYASDVEALATRLPHIDLTIWPNFAHMAE